MRTHRVFLFALAGLFLLMGGGCAPAPTTLGPDYGMAYGLAVHNQVLNPDAASNLQPVTGLDGQASANVMTRYRKSFAEPAPPPTIIPSVVMSGVQTK